MNRFNINKWYATYLGMCQEIFGYKEDGSINFPEYGTSAEEVLKEMKISTKPLGQVNDRILCKCPCHLPDKDLWHIDGSSCCGRARSNAGEKS